MAFPQLFRLAGAHVGVKKAALDLAVILSDRPAAAAACFTRNVFKAAPVVVSDAVLRESAGYANAVVVNSGCANAVTGAKGLADAWAMSKAVGPGTLVMSTGVIGVNLPIEKIITGITHIQPGTTASHWEDAAKAFMTTDTFPKLRSRSFTINGVEYAIAGMDKGAGMIHPNMGPPHDTLLGCILTDAPVEPIALQNALTYAVDRSFNSISVDGEMSTNDSIFLLANGAAGGSTITQDTPEWIQFRDILTDFSAELAQLVVRDGEGATKFVTVNVRNAATYRDAHTIASRISTSALVKTALFGEDANWGRILAATGSVPDTVIDPSRVSVTFVPSDGSAAFPVLVNGEPLVVDEERAKQVLSLRDIEIVVDLAVGDQTATYWTCDLSHVSLFFLSSPHATHVCRNMSLSMATIEARYTCTI